MDVLVLFACLFVGDAFGSQVSNPTGFVNSGHFTLSQHDTKMMREYINTVKSFNIDPKSPNSVKNLLNRVKGRGSDFERNLFPKIIQEASNIGLFAGKIISVLGKMGSLTNAALDSGNIYTIGELANIKPAFKAVVEELKSLQALSSSYLTQASRLHHSLNSFVQKAAQDKRDLDHVANSNPEHLAGYRKKRWLFGLDKLIVDKVIKPIVNPIVDQAKKLRDALIAVIKAQQKMAAILSGRTIILQRSIQNALPAIQKIQGTWQAIRDDIQNIRDFRPVTTSDPNQSVFPFQINIASALWRDVKTKAMGFAQSANQGK